MCNTWRINRFVSCFFVGRYYSSISLHKEKVNWDENNGTEASDEGDEGITTHVYRIC